jgi:hypothetical protein
VLQSLEEGIGESRALLVKTGYGADGRRLLNDTLDRGPAIGAMGESARLSGSLAGRDVSVKTRSGGDLIEES